MPASLLIFAMGGVDQFEPVVSVASIFERLKQAILARQMPGQWFGAHCERLERVL